jgi:hypothetical protein
LSGSENGCRINNRQDGEGCRINNRTELHSIPVRPMPPANRHFGHPD